MRLFHLIPLSLLALLPYSLATSNSQSPLHSPEHTLSTTLVDKLSEDPDFTTLLRLLQRAKLIPTLNRLKGCTFFAPTNDAIHRDASLSLLSSLTGDNVNEQLRQELFYHLLNYPIKLPKDNNVLVTKTLHFPHDDPEPPSGDPPPSPPWLPIPGGTLGGEPQRLRVAARKGQLHVGVDAFGKGGVKAIKGPIDAGNGLLIGIDSILPVPPSLAKVISTHPSTSYFHKILTPAVINRLNETAELTIFVPVDSAWNALHPVEKLYLESEFATEELIHIFEMHAVVQHGVKWSESFKPAVNLTTLDGRKLNVVIKSDKVFISDAELVQPDIYASNGVLHTVSSLLIPEGALKITPEKYLLALNCTNFISMIHSVHLNHLIDNTDTEYTILVPQDDVFLAYGDENLPEKGSDELKRFLKYHFLPGRWTPKTLQDGLLIETKLDEPGLDGGHQVLEASISHGSKEQTEALPSISFGGASIIGDSIEVHGTVIYFISHPLVPPGNSLQVALPTLNLSSFLAAIFSADLADTIKTSPRTTLLVPHNDAFKRLGLLVSAHLLSTPGKADLESVILHHVIDDVVYAQDLKKQKTARTYPTLEGSDLHVDLAKSGSISLNPSGGWPGLMSELSPMNLLSETGVVHELSDIFIPRSVQLTVGKLAKAAKGTTMTNLILKAGMEWVLNGTAPPADSPWGQNGISGTGWTLLCPSDDAFKKVNLTQLYSDKAAMQLIVGQHLLNTPNSDFSGTPNNNQPLLFHDSDIYATLISPESNYRDVIFREDENGEVVVAIKNALGTGGKVDWAKVTAWGRATTGGGTGGVIQIDRLLVPYQPPLWMEYGVPIVVGIFGILAISAFFVGVRKVWKMDRTEATYEPVGGFSREDDEES